MHKVYVIGIGPGTKDYLLPIARRQIQKADCLIGARRILSLFKNLNKEKVYLEGDFKRVISYIKGNRNKKRIAILVSGDPCLHSFLGQIQKLLKKKDYEVIPGISALQMAFARIGESWEDTKIISLHGRKLGNLAKVVKKFKKVFLFSDAKSSPQRIATYLLNKRIRNRRVVVFEELSYPNERIVDADLKGLSKMEGSGLCVILIKE